MQRSIHTTASSLKGIPAAMLASCYENRFGALADVTHAYYATDDFVAGADLWGVSQKYLETELTRQLAEADVVLAVSDELASRLSTPHKPAVLLPNGCDPEHFSGVDQLDFPQEVYLRPPIAGLIGQISDRIDVVILERIVESKTSLLVVGPINPSFEPERMARILSRPNVQWVGPRSFSELPRYMRAIDVGITPYTQSEFNRASFPLKALEYLSAGRGSVATALPALARLDSNLVRVASTTSEFIEHLTRELRMARTKELATRRLAFAEQHSWDQRARALLTALQLEPLMLGS